MPARTKMARKQLKGKIKSQSGPQTVSVEVVRVFHHPRYRKRIRRSKSYLAHFEGEVEVGQAVVIEESRPISHRKHWRVVEASGKKGPEDLPKADESKPEKTPTSKTGNRIRKESKR